MGAASAGLQSPQSSMPAGKGAGASPSTPAGSTNSATYSPTLPAGLADSTNSSTFSPTSGQPTLGAPNTNSNTGMDLAPAGKGGGSSIAGTPASPYIAEPQSFRNVDASGNPVTPMSGLGRYANTVGGQPISYLGDRNQLPTGGPAPNLPDQSQMNIGTPNSMVSNTQMPRGASGKGAAAGGSQGKGPQ